MGYFRSPVAYVFLAVFLVAAVGLPWFVGGFFEGNQANLERFFTFLPWVFLFLIPAVGMRLWSEERRAGTWELLFTLPISVSHAVVGKFLAAWAFVSLAIVLTITMPITIAYLGSPDWGPVFTGYFGSILMAGAYLGIC
ncbi:MAG TPA: ABC transporter permease, partial [Opitutales bacterium]|nr:ABC transporter permease [Opitutales bacterium]